MMQSARLLLDNILPMTIVTGTGIYKRLDNMAF